MEKAIGLHRRRLTDSNPVEQAFIETWHEEHDRRDLLFELLRVECEADDPDREGGGLLGNPLGFFHKYPLGDVTDRDRVVAETVVQWLGSNCGRDFIRQALRASEQPLKQ